MQNSLRSGHSAKLANQRFQQAIAQQALRRATSNVSQRILNRNPTQIFSAPSLLDVQRSKPVERRLQTAPGYPVRTALPVTSEDNLKKKPIKPHHAGMGAYTELARKTGFAGRQGERGYARDRLDETTIIQSVADPTPIVVAQAPPMRRAPTTLNVMQQFMVHQGANLTRQIRVFKPNYAEFTRPGSVPTARHLTFLQSLLARLKANQANQICIPQNGIIRGGNLPTLNEIQQFSDVSRGHDRNGLSYAGRALQKHSNRPGSRYNKPSDGKAATANREGEYLVDTILTNQGSTFLRRTVRDHNAERQLINVRSPNGDGLEFRLPLKAYPFRSGSPICCGFRREFMIRTFHEQNDLRS